MSDTNPVIEPPDPGPPERPETPKRSGDQPREVVGDAPALLPRDGGELLT